MTIPYHPTNSTSPDDKPVPSCSNVDPDFLELTLPHLILQSELDDLGRDLNLLKIQADLLASYLQGWNLLQQGVKMSYRKHQLSLPSFFSTNSELGCFNDVGLLARVGMYTQPRRMVTFVDLSKFILKAVPLHNRNIHPSILISHSVHMKEMLQVTQSMDGKYVETFTPRNAVWLHKVVLFSL